MRVEFEPGYGLIILNTKCIDSGLPLTNNLAGLGYKGFSRAFVFLSLYKGSPPSGEGFFISVEFLAFTGKMLRRILVFSKRGGLSSVG